MSVVSIFDLEEDINRGPSKKETASLPFFETSQAQRQKSSQRPRNSGGSGSGLPQSLSALRPISLPSSSNSQLVTPSESTVSSPKQESAPDSMVGSPESVNPYFASNGNEAMLELVAAHTPSHRGLWDKDNGKVWSTIMGEDTRRASASKNPIDGETASINDEIGGYIYLSSNSFRGSP